MEEELHDESDLDMPPSASQDQKTMAALRSLASPAAAASSFRAPGAMSPLNKRNFINLEVPTSSSHRLTGVQRESDLSRLDAAANRSNTLVRMHLVAGVLTVLQLIASIVVLVELDPEHSQPILLIWQGEGDEPLESANFSASTSMTAGLFIVQIACLVEHALCFYFQRFFDTADFIREASWAVTAVVMHCQFAMMSGVTDFVALYFIFITSMLTPLLVFLLKGQSEQEYEMTRLRFVPLITLVVHIAPIFVYFAYTIRREPRYYAIGHLVGILVEYIYLQLWYFKPDSHALSVVLNNVGCSIMLWVFLLAA